MNADERPVVIYVAGRFTGPTPWDVAENVRHAERYGLLVAKAGAMPLIPHANTALFHGQLTGDFWYRGTEELLSLCDGLVLIPGWKESRGSARESLLAHAMKMPVLDLDDTYHNEALEALQDFVHEVKTQKKRAS